MPNSDVISLLEDILRDYDYIWVDCRSCDDLLKDLFCSYLDDALVRRNNPLSLLLDYRSIHGIENISKGLNSNLFPKSNKLTKVSEKNVLITDATEMIPSLDSFTQVIIYSKEKYNPFFKDHIKDAKADHLVYLDNQLNVFSSNSPSPKVSYEEISIFCYKKPTTPNYK